MARGVEWAAGLFEGEGSLSTYLQRGNVRHNAAMSSVDKDVLDAFASVVGVGKVLGPYGPYKNNQVKPQWRWQVSAKADVLHVIDLLRPYMLERRAQRMDEVLNGE